MHGRCTWVRDVPLCSSTARACSTCRDMRPTTVDNVALRCRAHNAYEAELFFGPLIVREDRTMFGEERSRSGPSGCRSPIGGCSGRIESSAGR
jgi:hypothetical protein